MSHQPFKCLLRSLLSCLTASSSCSPAPDHACCAVGTVSVYIRNTTVHCSQATANSSAGSGSSSESSSGTPGWVWAIVGVAAAVAATLLLAGVLWRQRRKRRRQQQDLVAVKVVDSAELPSGPSSSTPKQGSDELVSGPLTSAGNSGMLDGLSGSIPEGPWKTRCGHVILASQLARIASPAVLLCVIVVCVFPQQHFVACDASHKLVLHMQSGIHRGLAAGWPLRPRRLCPRVQRCGGGCCQ